MAGKPISPADAVKAFRGRQISVLARKPAKVKAKDQQGKEVIKDGFESKIEPLAEKHVHAAAQVGDRVVMTTVDGKKYETAATKSE